MYICANLIYKTYMHIYINKHTQRYTLIYKHEYMLVCVCMCIHRNIYMP